MSQYCMEAGYLKKTNSTFYTIQRERFAELLYFCANELLNHEKDNSFFVSFE